MRLRPALALALVLPFSFALGWVSGVERWPPSDQLIAWFRGRPTRPQQRQELLRNVRPSQVVVVGDSITAEGLWAEYFNPALSVANRGFPGATTADLLALLPVITAPRARLYLVMAGVNDVLYASWGPEQTVSNLLALRRKLLAFGPGVKVVIQSTLECLPPQCSDQALERIRTINHGLEQSLPSDDFLDLNAVLSSPRGLRRSLSRV